MATKKRKSTNINPYEVLGINAGSTPAEIDKAFKKLALKWHPDKNPNSKELAQKKFIEIYKAYELLKEQKDQIDAELQAKERRAQYESERKASSSAARQHHIAKLRERESAFEEKQKPKSKQSTPSGEDAALLRQLRAEGAQLLRKMAEDAAAAEVRHSREAEQRQNNPTPPAAAVNPDTKLYGMSLDELARYEEEILGL